MLKFFSGLLPLTCLAALGGAEAAPARAGDPWASEPLHARCVRSILRHERANAIPEGLLLADALARARLLLGQARLSPYSVAADGVQERHANHAAAVARAEGLTADRTLRLGCLLVAYGRHDVWLPLDSALYADRNALYMARFYNKVRKTRSDWTQTVGYVWSKRPASRSAHICRVAVAWRGTDACKP